MLKFLAIAQNFSKFQNAAQKFSKTQNATQNESDFEHATQNESDFEHLYLYPLTDLMQIKIDNYGIGYTLAIDALEHTI